MTGHSAPASVSALPFRRELHYACDVTTTIAKGPRVFPCRATKIPPPEKRPQPRRARGNFSRLAVIFLFALAGLLPGFAATNDIVHMLVPGFTVRELPVAVNNLNNLRFAPDGTLTALGYDGRVWLIKDTNGDGLEDAVEPFWDKPTLSVPVGMEWSTRGLFVSSKGKVSLLRDTNGDGRADEEEVIASGWPATDVGSGGVDATAVTLDSKGNIYFGLLVADYSNAYRLRQRKDLRPEEKAWLEARGDKGGPPEEEVSIYDINSKRGTIQKWDAGTHQLQTVATGIRVPYALHFNRAGDLFNTDQEGETWMPHGNPLDEFNQIKLGKNYGFPPRHDHWLPTVVSEPPIIAFGPQHQSSCGFVFNEPHGPLNPSARASAKTALPSSPGQGRFGPEWWEGDAIVAGESRGKLWRVRLVKTPNGYVGKEYIIARLSMLTMDVAISPRGDLYVCCHSGGPDWGTGPNGPGKILKISYTDSQAPQPVAAWANGVTETRIAFDKALDPSVTNQLAGAKIETGAYVRAGDRYEVLKPPYRVVEQQIAAPRSSLNVIGATLADDNQTLVLETDPQLEPVMYALAVPGIKAGGASSAGETVDVDYTLGGVSVYSSNYKPFMSKPAVRRLASRAGLATMDAVWGAWLPHAEMAVSAALLSPSRYFQNVSRSLGTGRDLATIVSARFNLPFTNATLHMRSATPFMANAPQAGIFRTNSHPAGRIHLLELRVNAELGRFPCDLSWKGSSRDLQITYSTAIDPTERPLPAGFFIAPWLMDDFGDEADGENPPPKLAETNAPDSGDWENGKSLFHGELLKCATCHRIRGEGQTIGPDLSNLIHRDTASVLRDIREPSAAINPDYVTYNITRKDDEVFTGFIRAQGREALQVFGADGKDVVIPRAELKDFRPSAVSLMPTGLLDGLKEEQVRDLLTYLMHAPPERTLDEAKRVIAARPTPPASKKHLKIVLVASKQDHGPGQHDYPAWQKTWHPLLAKAGAEVTVEDAWLWPTPEQFQSANVIVFNFWNHEWTEDRYRQLDDYQARGGGIVLLHAATIADSEPEKLAERIGIAAQPVRTKYVHEPMDLRIAGTADHPLTAGLPQTLPLLDELYWPMIGDVSRVNVLATTRREGEERPVIWTFQKGPGRVFASIAGHYTWTLNDPVFRVLILRGIAWAAGEPTERLQDLITASQ